MHTDVESTQSVAHGATNGYPSFISLRAAHADLLKLQRTDGQAPVRLDLVEDFLRRGQAAGALLDDERERVAAQSLLNYWSTLLDRAGTEQPVPTLADFDPLLAPVLDDKDRPYLGLAAFREADHSVFFGRQRLVNEWVGCIANRDLLAVIGSSGSGKSSLVLGGLVPALRSGAVSGSDRWRYYDPLVPGSDPLDNLARAVLPEGPPSLTLLEDHAARFRSDSGHLAELVGASGDVATLLIIDQFEELFTLCTDAAQRQAFIDNLLHLVAPPNPWPSRHIAIVTMRTDFESHIARVPALQGLFEQSAVRVTALSATELREAIEQPAELVGLKFEAGIIDELVKEMLGEPAGLPLLQFSLLKLWERRERNRIAWAAYRQLGGARRALGVCADEFYSNLIPQDQMTARRILLQLVRPGEGKETTSNRLRRERLFASGEAPDRVERVLHKLVDAHLLRLTEGDSAADDQVEIAHEALIRNWEKLDEWLDDERANMRHRIRFTSAAEQWRSAGRDPELLLRGSALAESDAFTELSDIELEFITASRAAVEQAERDREEARLRVLAQEQALVFEQQGRARARRWLAAVTVALIFSLAFGVLAVTSNQRATEAEASARMSEASALDSAKQANDEAVRARAAEADALQQSARADAAAALAHAREFLSVALANLDVNPERSMLFSRLASTISPSLDVRDMLQLAMQSSRILRSLEGHTDQVVGVAFGPDNTTLASSSSDGTVRLWDASSGQVKRILTGDGQAFLGVAFSQDGRLVAACGASDTVWVWDARSGEVVQKLTDADGYWQVGVAFNPAGTLLASAGVDGKANLWDATSGEKIREFRHSASPLNSVAFSPDGTRLATGSVDKLAKLWDVDTGKSVRTLSGHRATVTAVAFSPDGKMVATGSQDDTVRVWNASSGGLLDIFAGHTNSVFGVAFDPTSQRVASSSADGSARVWSLDSRRELFTLHGHSGPVGGIAYSPDGSLLATAGWDDSVRVWDAFNNHNNAVGTLVFSQDGTRLVTSSSDGTAAIWDAGSGRVMQWLHRSGGDLTAIDISPDGKLVASTDASGAQLWDAASGSRLQKLAMSGSVQGIAFSPDGKLLATSDDYGTTWLWDVSSGKRQREFADNQAVLAVAFSPDSGHLATAKDRVVYVRDINSNSDEPIIMLTGHTDRIYSLAFRPDGQQIVTGSLDGTVRLWDATSGVEQQRLFHSDSPIAAVAYSSDGRFVATGGFDHTARIFDVQSGAEVRTLTHRTEVQTVAFSPDGKILASGASDGNVYMNPLDDAMLLDRVRAHLTRGLTATECQQFLRETICPPSL